MRGKEGEEIIALIPTDTELGAVAKALRALSRSHKGAMVRDVEHSGTYTQRGDWRPYGVMEVFVPAKPKAGSGQRSSATTCTSIRPGARC